VGWWLLARTTDPGKVSQSDHQPRFGEFSDLGSQSAIREKEMLFYWSVGRKVIH